MKKYFIVLSFVLMLLMLSSAVLADFSITTEDAKKTVCIGSTAVLVDKVAGTDGKYTVEASGSATSFATTVPTEFSGASQNIYSYITISSKIRPGVYDLTVKAKSGNISKEQYHEITAKDCHGTSLIIDSDKKACPCEKVKYKLTLENQGEFTEKFKISVDGSAKSWTNLSITSAELKSGESTNFYAYTETPCDIDGSYTLNFKAIAEASLAGATASAKLDILPCYEYNLDAEKEYNICENEKLNIPVSIDNKGTAGNTFEIIMDGPDWAKLSSKSVDVDAETKKTFDVSVQPPFKTEGNFTLKLETMTSAGNVKKTIDTKVNVRRCYGLTMDLQKADKICKKDKEYDIVLTNLGEFKSKYDLSIDGPDWAKLDSDNVRVDAKDNATVTLKLNPKTAEYKTYDITVNAKDTESNEETSKKISVEVVTSEECYKSELTADKDSLSIEIEKSKTVFLMLKNNGLDDANYNIELSGKGSKFAIVNPNEIELKPADSETLYLYVSPPLFTDLGKYNLTITAEEKNSKVKIEKTIEINLVEEGQLAENETAAGITIEPKQPNIFMRAINAITGFFKKIFMIKSVSNETISNQSEVIENASQLIESSDVIELANVTEENNETIEIINETITIENKSAAEELSNESLELEDNATAVINGTEESNLSEDNNKITEISENDNGTVAEVSNQSEKIESIKSFDSKASGFFNANKTYIIGAVAAIIIILLIASGAGKAIVDFFEEEENIKKK
jgi:uncharacterized membrane protein